MKPRLIYHELSVTTVCLHGPGKPSRNDSARQGQSKSDSFSVP